MKDEQRKSWQCTDSFCTEGTIFDYDGMRVRIPAAIFASNIQMLMQVCAEEGEDRDGYGIPYRS